MIKVSRIAGLRLRLDQQQRLSILYTEAGWPIVRGAWWDRSRYRCGGTECTVSGLHAAGHRDPVAGASVPAGLVAFGSDRPYTLLLATGRGVDVLELPALASTAMRAAQRLGGPVAQLPTGRWLLFAASDENASDGWAPVDPKRGDVLLHSTGSLVPVPPSRLSHGRVRWASRPGLMLDQLTPMAELVRRVVPLLPPPMETVARGERQGAGDAPVAAWARR